MKELITIFGAGGHTRSLIALLNDTGFDIDGVFDDNYNKTEKEFINGYEVFGTLEDYNFRNKVILSTGDNKLRKALFQKYNDHLLKTNVIHSSATIDSTVKMGESNFVFTNAILNVNASIGNNNIINTAAIIEHESSIGSHNHISVGTIICGRVKIGNNCFIGAGSVINDKISICSDVTIGSNSTVLNSITEPGVYVGSPIRKVK